MAVVSAISRISAAGTRWPWRSLLAVALALSVGCAGVVSAANNSVQGAKKEEGGFDGDAPTAILIEASSGSVLFEKNADELRAPSSMMKLMTAEVVFNALKKGEIKLTDEYRISENAWRKGGAPSGGSTMFAAIHSKVSVDDLLHGAIIQSGNDACIALAEGMAGNERTFADGFMTKRARELGLTKSTFANSNGLPDPGNKMTVRELAKLARHIIQTYPDFYKLFGETRIHLEQDPAAEPQSAAERAGRRRRAEDRLHQGGRLRHGRLRRAERHAADRRGQRARRSRRPRHRSQEDAGMGISQFRGADAVRREPAGRLRQGVWRREPLGQACQAREPIKVMVPKNGNEKLIARVVYNGPVRAPIEAGQPVGVVRVWRGANVAMEAPVYAAEPSAPARPCGGRSMARANS